MKKTTRLINEAIKDEKKAPGEYRTLRKRLKTKRDKQLINKIIRDEKKHQRTLKKIKKRLK